MKQFKHWQDPVNAVLGAALVLSPWAVGYFGEAIAATNAVVIGLALMATSLGAMLMPQAWEEWIEAVLGLWMVMSPWMLGFSHLFGATVVVLTLGMAVVVLSLWTLATDKKFSLPRSMLP